MCYRHFELIISEVIFQSNDLYLMKIRNWHCELKFHSILTIYAADTILNLDIMRRFALTCIRGCITK